MPDYTIAYFSEAVADSILSLPDSLAARYLVLTRRMVVLGPDLGEPHTRAMGGGLFELRLKGADGIGRVFFCTAAGRRIIMLHSFVKETVRTPRRELDLARQRFREYKNGQA